MTMDKRHERVINDWIGNTEDASAALQDWLDSLQSGSATMAGSSAKVTLWQRSGD